jgi:patatin-like phospholipase/acyl hydrolase
MRNSTISGDVSMRIRQFFITSLLIVFFSQNALAEKVIRILSLDGGGMRGIIEATILKEMETQLNKPISQIFDIITGTSVGGILAMALAAPNEDGGPLYTAAQTLNVIKEFGPSIFSSSLCHKIVNLGGLIGPKYETAGIERTSLKFLKDFKLSEAIIPIIVTGYDVQGECGIEFCSSMAKKHPNDLDCLMREVARATAAAPIFFPAAEVSFPWGKLEYIVDGALYKTNPATLAYLWAQKFYPDHQVEVYSIGSGKINAHSHIENVKSGGLLQWIRPIAHHFQNSDVESDHDLLHRLLNENGHDQYFRLNIDMGEYDRLMDDTSKEHIDILIQKGQDSLELPMFSKMLERLRQSLGRE